MYADRLEAETTTRRSLQERLDGVSADNSSRRRQVSGKRQRPDDKWEHDLYDNEFGLSNRKVDARDLRLKLQKKSQQQVSRTGNGAALVVRDLREKLSGLSLPQRTNAGRPKSTVVTAKPVKKNVSVEYSELESKTSSRLTMAKKSKSTAETSVDSFLQSLNLEKYAITLQAEEIDMTALFHMTDEDLKAVGIPMGPRKKILLALESRG